MSNLYPNYFSDSLSTLRIRVWSKSEAERSDYLDSVSTHKLQKFPCWPWIQQNCKILMGREEVWLRDYIGAAGFLGSELLSLKACLCPFFIFWNPVGMTFRRLREKILRGSFWRSLHKMVGFWVVWDFRNRDFWSGPFRNPELEWTVQYMAEGFRALSNQPCLKYAIQYLDKKNPFGGLPRDRQKRFDYP